METFTYSSARGQWGSSTGLLSLVLGLIVGLGNQYHIQSNRESGLGFYDIALIPKEQEMNQLGIIIELKKANSDNELAQKSIEAFDQIEIKKYTTELTARNVKKIALIGIAFSTKSVQAKHKMISVS